MTPIFENKDKIALLGKAFTAGLEAVMPSRFMADIAEQVKNSAAGKKVHVLSVGKAAGAMVDAYHRAGGAAGQMLIILPEGVAFDKPRGMPEDSVIIHSSHPVPNEASALAARAALGMADGLGADDVLVVLLSGGGSSLMSLGLDNVTLQDKQAVNSTLLASGMSIQRMNIIRKHISAIKGGRLGVAAAPAQVMSFAISDVPGDAPDTIASGPVSGDDSTKDQALELIKAYKLSLPDRVMTLLQKPECESPFPDDERLKTTSYNIVASAKHALEASAKVIQQSGYHVEILGDGFEEDTATLADIMEARLAQLPMGAALISGGEASVKIDGDRQNLGVGGRNAQFALEMAQRNLPDICGISCDTDGIDGGGKNAGALFYHGLTQDAEAQGITIKTYYERYDSHSFFEAMGCAVYTGPTQTNVNDLRIILKGAPSSP